MQHTHSCVALPDTLTRPPQGEGLLHRAAAAVGLASDKAHETKEAAKDQASKGYAVSYSR